MPKKSLYLLALFILVSTLLSACTLPWKKVAQEANQANDSNNNVFVEEKKTDRLKQFASYTELATFLSSHKASAATNWEPNTPIENIIEFKDNPVSSLTLADTLKQVDDIIYSLVKDELLVLQIESPESTTLLGKMKFPFRPNGLFLEDGALVVYGADENIPSSATYKSRQFIRIFDISNPSDPRESRDLAFEGDFSQAFVRGGYLYLLTERNTYNPAGSAVPQVFENNKVLSNKCDSNNKCFSPSVFYFDSVYNSYRLLSINAISLKSPTEAISGQIYVLNGQQHYAALGENIYIFHLKSSLAEISWQAKKEAVLKRLDEENKKIISEINNAPGYLLSNEEKEAKFSLVIDNFINKMSLDESLLLEIEIDDAIAAKLNKQSAVAKTIIHKLVPAGATIDYFASAETNGLLLSSDSANDDGEYLYLATKAEQSSESTDKKYLSSLVIFDKLLEPVGKLENLSTKEEIYGARFIGERAFLVATAEGSSVFVVSLEDKKAPNYIGTLKVPGAKNLLRSIDKDGKKFLSLSYDSDSEDLEAGDAPVKLSLYDFSDLKQPKEIDSFLIGDAGSDSIVFSDFNAMFYSDTDSVLSVPISFKTDGRLNFSGALIFSVDGSVMELKGKLDHSSGGFYNQPDQFNGVTYLENTARRSLFHNGVIYTFSNKFLRYGALGLLDGASSLELSVNSDDLLISSLLDDKQDANNPDSLNEEIPYGEATNPDMSDPGMVDPSMYETNIPLDTPPVDANPVENFDGAFDLVPPPPVNEGEDIQPAI